VAFPWTRKDLPPQSAGRCRYFLVAGSGILGVLLGVLAWAARDRLGRGPAQSSDLDVEDETRPAASPWFRDTTAESGVSFTYRNGEEADHYSILESLGGGVALIDYDGDGLLDLFVPGGGRFGGSDRRQIAGLPCALYKNLGGWKFRDVTAETGLDGISFYTHGCAVGDYDKDGWPDLLVTGYGRLALYHNEGDGRGGRRFVEVTRQAGLLPAGSPLHWSTSAAWGDLTGKGFADLYVCQYLDWSFAPDKNPVCVGHAPGVARDVCPPETFVPLPHLLYHNRGDGTFQDATAQAGILPGAGLGILLADLNEDGRPDLYVANDATGNILYFNRGGGRLEEKGAATGVALDERGKTPGSMGVDAGDYDGSGRPSLFVTNFEHQLHALYRNLGEESFQFSSRAAGIAALGQRFVGFGTAFVDVDNDGWEDLVIANGHVLRHPLSGTPQQRPVLMHNVEYKGRRFFEDVGRQGGPFFSVPARGRGLAVGDLDNDGWPDLVIGHSNGPVVLLRNEAGGAGGVHWLGVRLVGRGNRPVAGATATLQAGGRTLTRFAKGGGSYLSTSDPRLLFGLGGVERVGRLTVRWPWGPTETWEGLQADCYWEVREGQREARRIPGIRVQGGE
jgi:hypothetical protein